MYFRHKNYWYVIEICVEDLLKKKKIEKSPHKVLSQKKIYNRKMVTCVFCNDRSSTTNRIVVYKKMRINIIVKLYISLFGGSFRIKKQK